MAGEATSGEPGRAAGTSFRRVVCGVDGSPEAAEAARQAARLVEPGGELLLVSAVDPWDTVLGQHGTELDAAGEARRARAEAALAEGRSEAEGAAGDAGIALSRRAASGRATTVLLDAARSESADLVAVGSHGTGRIRGIALGSTATVIVHEAPCAVLVARRPGAAGPTQAIAVGFDGSPHSRHALEVARALAGRLGCSLRVVSARGGKPLPDDLLAEVEELELDPRPPADALADASARADLLVVGSRGLHGLRALGSVSERVVHAAESSVLVVRPPTEES